MAGIRAQDSIDRETRRRAVQAAQGNVPFDLLITGGEVVDVVAAVGEAAGLALDVAEHRLADDDAFETLVHDR